MTEAIGAKPEVAAMVRAGVRPQPGDVCWFDLPDG